MLILGQDFLEVLSFGLTKYLFTPMLEIIALKILWLEGTTTSSDLKYIIKMLKMSYVPVKDFCNQRTGKLKIHHSEDLGKGVLEHDRIL